MQRKKTQTKIINKKEVVSTSDMILFFNKDSTGWPGKYIAHTVFELALFLPQFP